MIPLALVGQGRDLDLREERVSGSTGTLKVVSGFGQAFLLFVTSGKEGQVVALGVMRVVLFLIGRAY